MVFASTTQWKVAHATPTISIPALSLVAGSTYGVKEMAEVVALIEVDSLLVLTYLGFS